MITDSPKSYIDFISHLAPPAVDNQLVMDAENGVETRSVAKSFVVAVTKAWVSAHEKLQSLYTWLTMNAAM